MKTGRYASFIVGVFCILAASEGAEAHTQSRSFSSWRVQKSGEVTGTFSSSALEATRLGSTGLAISSPVELLAALLERREQQLVALGILDEPGSSAAALLTQASELTQRAASRALARIAALDAEQRAALEAQRRAVLGELPGLDAGRRAAAAYGAQGREHGPGPAYVDAAS